MSDWTHAQCEACWINENSTWVPTPTGPDDERLDSIRQPVRVVAPEGEALPVERCCWCGQPTIVGIFVRRDPATLALCLGGHG